MLTFFYTFLDIRKYIVVIMVLITPLIQRRDIVS